MKLGVHSPASCLASDPIPAPTNAPVPIPAPKIAPTSALTNAPVQATTSAPASVPTNAPEPLQFPRQHQLAANPKARCVPQKLDCCSRNHKMKSVLVDDARKRLDALYRSSPESLDEVQT